MHLQLFSMSIVTLTSQAYALQNYQTIQNYNYQPLNSTLDPITAQIIKTNDSVLEVMKQVENGTAQKFLDHENRTVPHYTWLGKLIDKLFRWGEYHPNYREETSKRSLPEWNCTDEKLIIDYINASFKVQKFLNNSCNRLNITQYWTELHQIFSPKNDVICRINTCVRNRLLACYPNCLPCQNATDLEKNITDPNGAARWWRSKLYKEMIWQSYVAVKDFKYKQNLWVADNIHDFFNSTITACEDQELNPKPQSSYVYLSLLVVPAAAGIIIFGVCINKKKTPLPSYEEISSV